MVMSRFISLKCFFSGNSCQNWTILEHNVPLHGVSILSSRIVDPVSRAQLTGGLSLPEDATAHARATYLHVKLVNVAHVGSKVGSDYQAGLLYQHELKILPM